MEQQSFEPQQTSEMTPQATPQKRKSGLATAGLVLGIVGICTSFIPIVNNASFFLGALAVIFGVIALCKKASTAKAITSLILGVLSVVITLSMQASWEQSVDDAFNELEEDLAYMAGDKIEDILENYLSVTMGQFVVIQDEYWEDTEMKITLKNKSNQTHSFDVMIEAVDQNGNRITTDSVYVSDLAPGQGQEFKIFTLVTSDDIPKLKNAEFRIVSTSMY